MGVFVRDASGDVRSVARVRCSDESHELQGALFNAHDLLPGDQIDPEDPRHWLLVRRELPVLDSSGTAGRWSLDFFFLDQDAVPTFVECKRFRDTRSRREVVAQMIEYAANSQHSLDAASMRRYAEASASARGVDLRDLFDALGSDFAAADELFERAEANLKEGRVRLVFFLEESPPELRRLVDFLNGQMTRAEVLLVEVGMYRHGDTIFLCPSLHGYSPQASALKKDFERREIRRSRPLAGDEEFLASLETLSGKATVEKACELFQRLEALGVTRSYTPRSARFTVPACGDRTIMLLGVDAAMYFDVSWMDKPGPLFDRVVELGQRFGAVFDASAKGRGIKPKLAWTRDLDSIVSFFNSIMQSVL